LIKKKEKKRNEKKRKRDLKTKVKKRKKRFSGKEEKIMPIIKKSFKDELIPKVLM